MYKRGEIWLANLNPGKGTEPGEIRPVLIIQCQDLLDAFHPSTLVIPLTTNLINDVQPLRFRIIAEGKLAKDSDLLVDQIRALDNKRIIEGPLLQCAPSLMAEIDHCITEIFGF